MKWRSVACALACALAFALASAISGASAPEVDASTTPASPENAPPTYLITAPLLEMLTAEHLRASGGITITSEGLEVKADQADADLRERRLTATGNVTVRQDGSAFEAPDRVEGNLLTNEWRVPGSFSVQQDNNTLHAQAGVYNTEKKTGRLENARGQYGVYFISGREVVLEPDEITVALHTRASTCNLPRPHWSVGARRIEVHGESYAVASGMGVWIGDTKLFSFPKYRFQLHRPPSAFLLPTPGYDGRDGGYLRFRYPFSTPWTTASAVTGRLTQRSGVQGVVEVQRSLTAPRDNSSPDITPDVLSDLMDMKLLSGRAARPHLNLQTRQPLETQDTEPTIPAMKSQLFARAAWNERVFDPSARFLALDRLPEVGVRLLDVPAARISGKGNPLMLDLQSSYGRFRENDDQGFIGRFDVRATARLKTGIGDRWKLEPAILARYSSYSDSRQQKILAGSLSVGRQITPRYFGALTYIRHSVSGKSPLEFDDVDIREKLSTRVEGAFGRTWASLTVDFDLQTGGIYDWTVQFAKRMHCFEPRFGYQNRYRNFSFGIAFTLPS